VCFVVHKTTSELEHVMLTTMILPVQKTPTVGTLGRGIYSVFSSERSAGSLICTRHRFEFIANYFHVLSRSSRRSNSDSTFIGSTHSGTPSPWWAMIQDSTEEFLTTSGGEGGTGSHHNHTMDGECSGHLGHDDGSTTDSNIVVGYRPLLQAMVHS
jgi:hypothetical protein